MSQPVKLSDELVMDARQTASVSERSIAGQIEFWAQLGRSIEPLLRGDRALALKMAGEKPLSQLISEIDSELGRKRVCEYLSTRPYPHFEPVSENPGHFYRIESDGTRTAGRFVNRQFIVE